MIVGIVLGVIVGIATHDWAIGFVVFVAWTLLALVGDRVRE